MVAKSQKAFRRAALRRSKTVWLFCHVFIICAVEVGNMDKDIDDLIFGGEDPGPSRR